MPYSNNYILIPGNLFTWQSNYNSIFISYRQNSEIKALVRGLFDDSRPRWRTTSALGVSIVFPTTETVVPLIAKAYREALGLSVSAAIPTRDSIGILLAKADSQMLSVASAVGSDDERIAARLSARSAVAAAPVTAAAPAVQEEEEEEEEVSEEEAAAGLSALFG